MRVAAIGSFDNLNNFTIKGNAASGLGLIYDTLMDTSLDEPSAAYGLVAETVSHPTDFSSVTFTLRKQAQFHDGSPVKAEDVAFSLKALRDANPFYRTYYRDVAGTDILGPHKIRIRFAAAGNRELPLYSWPITRAAKSLLDTRRPRAGCHNSHPHPSARGHTGSGA